MKQTCYTLQYVIDAVKSNSLDVQSFEVMLHSLEISLSNGVRLFIGLSYTDVVSGNDVYLNSEFSSIWLIHYYLSIHSLSDVQFFIECE